VPGSANARGPVAVETPSRRCGGRTP